MKPILTLKIIFIFIIFMKPTLSSELKIEKCSENIQWILNYWHSNNNWQYKEDNLHITDTSEFGKWIWLKDSDREYNVSLVTQFEHSVLTIKKDNCSEKYSTISTPNKNKNAKTIFLKTTDDQLNIEIKKLKNGIIYFWSPQMPLSYRGIFTMKKVAKKNNLALLVFTDPEAKFEKNHGFKKIYIKYIDSFEFKMRNVYPHYPSIMAFKNGKIINKIKYGYENSEGFGRDVKKIFDF